MDPGTDFVGVQAGAVVPDVGVGEQLGVELPAPGRVDQPGIAQVLHGDLGRVSTSSLRNDAAVNPPSIWSPCRVLAAGSTGGVTHSNGVSDPAVGGGAGAASAIMAAWRADTCG